MNGGKIASGLLIIILGLVLFVGIPVGGGYEYALVYPPLLLVFLALGIYRIFRGLTEAPKEEFLGASSPGLDELSNSFGEAVADFVEQKYRGTANRTESKAFSRAAIMYVRVHGLPDFLSKSPEELKALMLGESGWSLEERLKTIRSWTDEALNRLWIRWESQRNAM